MSTEKINVLKSDINKASAELAKLFVAYKKALLKEEEIEQRYAHKLLEVEAFKEKLLSKIGTSSEELKKDMHACFDKWRALLEEQTGTPLMEIACNYGNVGMKESKPAVVIAEHYNEADILQRLKDSGLEQFIVQKERLDKQLVLRCYDDEVMAKALQQVGIRAEKKENFYIKLK